MITRSARAGSGRPEAGDVLLHPVAILALAILVLNDHVLKAAYPGLVTGKLSDVAGVALLPLVLVAGWELLRAASGRRSAPRAEVLVAAILVTGLGFAVVKVAPPAAEAFGWLLGAVQWPIAALSWITTGQPLGPPVPAPIVIDPGDLIALPALALAAWVAARRVRGIAAEREVSPS